MDQDYSHPTSSLSKHSFKQKGMNEAISFLEEINMIANVGGWEMDLENNELYWTMQTRRIQDLPDDYQPDFRKSLGFYKPGENQERLQRLVRRAIKEGIPFDEEFQLITAKGREIWVRSICRPVIVNSRCTRLYGSVQDITEIKELLSQNAELTGLYDMVVQLSGKLIHSELEHIEDEISKALKTLGELIFVERVFIFEPDADFANVIMTREWSNKGIDPEIDNHRSIPVQLLAAWQRSLEEDHQIVIHNAREFSERFPSEYKIFSRLSINSAVVLPMFSGNKLIGLLGFSTQTVQLAFNEQTIALLTIAADIIAGSISRIAYEKSLIAARQEAEAESKAKSEFLLNMGHEIKTRLHEILGFSELVLSSTKEEKSKQQLEIVAQSGKALLGLFGDLLELSKLELSREIQKDPTNIKDMLEEIKQLFLPVIQNKQIAISLNLPSELPVFIIDQRRLRHALINLIGNAVKFTMRGSVSVIVTYQEVNHTNHLYNINIAVKDTGIGIAEGMKMQITEFFDKPGSIFKKQGGEVGLGLYILKRLISFFQGKLSLQSELGKGSRFTLHIENIEALIKKTTTESIVENTEPIRFRGQKILLVEDMVHHFIMAQTFLENDNLELFHAKSGEEGVEMARKLDPDLILMDINMPPGINGYQATTLIKQDPATRNIPVIAYTTNTYDWEMESNRELFCDLLEKTSMSRQKLVEVLMKHLDHDTEEIDQQKIAGFDEPRPAENTEMLKELVASFSQRITKLIDIFDIMEIGNLIEDLENQNSNLNSRKLNLYLSELKDANDSFDFDKLNHLFKNFEQRLIQ